MKINRDNYEAYFLDYHEGQLSPEMVEEVKAFVALNPELGEAFYEFEAVTLTGEPEIIFDKKSSLKKNQVITTAMVNELNFEEFMISETEGLLSPVQMASLDEFIQLNPQFEKDRRLFALAHLPAENDIIYKAKRSLKQKAIPVGEITAETFETFMARELENDLSSEETLQFAEFMKYNPQLDEDRQLYKHTVLEPETGIVFEGKNRLKHSVTQVRRLVYYTLSVAASLALIMSVYFLLNRNDIPVSIAKNDYVRLKTDQSIKISAPVITSDQVAKVEQPATAESNDKVYTGINTASPDRYSNTSGKAEQQLAVTNHLPVELIQSRAAVEITNRNFVSPEFTFIRVSRIYSNQHTEFYYNLKLAEEIQYAELNSKDKNPGKTLLNAASEKAGSLFAMKRNNPSVEENKGFSMWTLAELGVQTLNTVTSSEMELKLTKDDEGKVIGYNLESGLFDIEKDLKK